MKIPAPIDVKEIENAPHDEIDVPVGAQKKQKLKFLPLSGKIDQNEKVSPPFSKTRN